MSTNKQTYQEQIESKLRDWGVELDRMRTKAQEVQGDAKAQYDAQIAQLTKWQEQARDKLTELRQSSDNSWQEVKSGVEDAITSLERGFSEASKTLGATWSKAIGETMGNSDKTSSHDVRRDEVIG